MPQLKFTVDLFGRTTIKAEGFVGGACAQHVEKFQKVLDGGSSNIENTDEMYHHEVEETQEGHLTH